MELTQGTRDCWNLIEHLKEGRALILVTHSMEETEYYFLV